MVKPGKIKKLKVSKRLELHISNQLRDPRNVRILALLREDPRMSISAVARRVGMSAPAIHERIQRLEDAGVIKGCRLELDPAALGYPVTAFVRIRPVSGRLARIVELAASLPQVVECHRITGEDCFIVKVYLSSLDTLDLILDQFLEYGQTTTSIVQSSPVRPRYLPLPTETETASRP